MTRKTRLAFGFLIGLAILLVINYLLGQTMAIIDYDFAVAIGLQESEHEVTEVGVALNKGFGLGDTFFYIPLLVIGIVGLIKRKTWGLWAMFAAMAVTIYWPLVAYSTLVFARQVPGFHFSDYTVYGIILSIILCYGVWASWFLYKHRRDLTD